MPKREIEISRKENDYYVYREYAIVYDDNSVEIRSSSFAKLYGNTLDHPCSRMPIEKLKNLVQQLD